MNSPASCRHADTVAIDGHAAGVHPGPPKKICCVAFKPLDEDQGG